MLNNNKLKLIICPYCKSALQLVNLNIGKNFGIVKCSCDEFPLILGIVYLRKVNKINKVLVNFIRAKKFNKALISLLSFSFRSKLFFILTSHFSFLYKFLGYHRFIKMLKYLSLSEGWTNYLKNRETTSDFIVRLLSLDSIKNSKQYIADFGCGTGYFLPYIYRFVDPANVIGVDISFLNLYIAQTFFANKNTLLICSNLNKGIPIKSDSIDIVFTADALNYLEKKEFFLHEIKRILASSGQSYITHIVNKDTTPPGLEIKPKKIIKWTKNIGLDYIIVSHKFIMQKLSRSNKVFFLMDIYLNSDHAYSLFLFKKKRLEFLTMTLDFYDKWSCYDFYKRPSNALRPL